jgi:hypothetical protein
MMYAEHLHLNKKKSIARTTNSRIRDFLRHLHERELECNIIVMDRVEL